MTNEQIVLAEIRKNIDALPENDRLAVTVIAQTLRNVITGGGEHARFALALIGAELAAE